MYTYTSNTYIYDFFFINSIPFITLKNVHILPTDTCMKNEKSTSANVSHTRNYFYHPEDTISSESIKNTPPPTTAYSKPTQTREFDPPKPPIQNTPLCHDKPRSSFNRQQQNNRANNRFRSVRAIYTLRIKSAGCIETAETKLPCIPLQRRHARRNTWKWNIFTWARASAENWKFGERPHALCL